MLVLSKCVATPYCRYSEFLAVIEDLFSESDKTFGSPNTFGIGLPFALDKNDCAISSNLDCVIGKPMENDIIEKLGRRVTLLPRKKAETKIKMTTVYTQVKILFSVFNPDQHHGFAA